MSEKWGVVGRLILRSVEYFNRRVELLWYNKCLPRRTGDA